MELYTGGLWPAVDLEVFGSDARLLTSELFAVGFRWSDRPRHAGRGLWHPDLEIGIDIIEARAVPSVADHSNTLLTVLDLDPSGPTDAASLKVVGIEDLIAQQVRCWLRDGAPSGALAAQVQALVGLGQAGVGGPFGASYLQRRLARETNGEVVVEMPRSEEGRGPMQGRRTMGLSEMQTRIGLWHDHCGLSSDPVYSQDLTTPADGLARSVCDHNDLARREGRFELPSAVIVPFDSGLFLIPR
ncbi:hypothetical protein [Acidisphaera sp. S103]|uniref:hypothetical protein n=1 Tax=Acidisphaera sp. S103 TaxID=1747223 RepID=UPI00131DFBB2|nr:hypothetical protein [Acidisphaera sp. S103]